MVRSGEAAEGHQVVAPEDGAATRAHHGAVGAGLDGAVPVEAEEILGGAAAFPERAGVAGADRAGGDGDAGVVEDGQDGLDVVRREDGVRVDGQYEVGGALRKGVVLCLGLAAEIVWRPQHGHTV